MSHLIKPMGSLKWTQLNFCYLTSCFLNCHLPIWSALPLFSGSLCHACTGANFRLHSEQLKLQMYRHQGEHGLGCPEHLGQRRELHNQTLFPEAAQSYRICNGPRPQQPESMFHCISSVQMFLLATSRYLKFVPGDHCCQFFKSFP